MLVQGMFFCIFYTYLTPFLWIFLISFANCQSSVIRDGVITSTPACGPDQRLCDGTVCGFICDGFFDCKDRTDERNCHLAKSCPEQQVRCPDGTCVGTKQECSAHGLLVSTVVFTTPYLMSSISETSDFTSLVTEQISQTVSLSNSGPTTFLLPSSDQHSAVLDSSTHVSELTKSSSFATKTLSSSSVAQTVSLSNSRPTSFPLLSSDQHSAVLDSSTHVSELTKSSSFATTTLSSSSFGNSKTLSTPTSQSILSTSLPDSITTENSRRQTHMSSYPSSSFVNSNSSLSTSQNILSTSLIDSITTENSRQQTHVSSYPTYGSSALVSSSVNYVTQSSVTHIRPTKTQTLEITSVVSIPVTAPVPFVTHGMTTETPPKENTFPPGYIVLIIVLSVILIVAVVAFWICHRKKQKTGYVM